MIWPKPRPVLRRGAVAHVFGGDQQNMLTMLQQAQRNNAFAVLPEYGIRGSISQVDEDVKRDNASLGVVGSLLGRRVILLNRPEDIHHVLVANPENYRRTAASLRDTASATSAGYWMLPTTTDRISKGVFSASARMRRVIARTGDGFLILPKGRELISYYANSVSHLLGEFEAAVRARDALPVHAVVDL